MKTTTHYLIAVIAIAIVIVALKPQVSYYYMRQQMREAEMVSQQLQKLNNADLYLKWLSAKNCN